MDTTILCIVDTGHKYCVSWMPDMNICIVDNSHIYNAMNHFFSVTSTK